MDDHEINRRLEACRQDYFEVTGKTTEFFVCPILGVDEQTGICKGHVINEAVGESQLWVPMRKDVDHFFGSVAEASFVSVTEDIGKNPLEIISTPNLHRQHRPTLELEGQQLQYYFPKKMTSLVDGHTRVKLNDANDETICELGLKISLEDLMTFARDGKDITIVVDRDYRPEVTCAALKAAHLTLFYLMGYRHVMSPPGVYVADILRDFYNRCERKHGVSIQRIKEYFSEHAAMIVPLENDEGSFFRGSISDRIFLTAWTKSNRPFMLGVIVKARQHRFCVFLPTDRGIDTYFSFLNERPISIRVRFARFNAKSSDSVAHWEINPTDHQLPFPR